MVEATVTAVARSLVNTLISDWVESVRTWATGPSTRTTMPVSPLCCPCTTLTWLPTCRWARGVGVGVGQRGAGGGGAAGVQQEQARLPALLLPKPADPQQPQPPPVAALLLRSPASATHAHTRTHARTNPPHPTTHPLLLTWKTSLQLRGPVAHDAPKPLAPLWNNTPGWPPHPPHTPPHPSPPGRTCTAVPACPWCLPSGCQAVRHE